MESPDRKENRVLQDSPERRDLWVIKDSVDERLKGVWMAFRANKDEQERWGSLERMGVSVSLVIEGQIVWMDLRASKEISDCLACLEILDPSLQTFKLCPGRKERKETPVHRENQAGMVWPEREVMMESEALLVIQAEMEI
eukprot:XP_011419739.1 PREDICTED: uncharacterized protein LOC105322617 [Crassostrea gigas]